jgi:hypothetical protein
MLFPGETALRGGSQTFLFVASTRTSVHPLGVRQRSFRRLVQSEGMALQGQLLTLVAWVRTNS